MCPIRPADKSANANGERQPQAAPSVDPTPLPPSAGMVPLLRQLLAEYAATGLPPAYQANPEPAAGQEPA